MTGTARHRCRIRWDHERKELHWDGVPGVEHWRHAEGDYELRFQGLRFQGLALDRHRIAVLIEPVYDHSDPRYVIPGVESSVRGWYQICEPDVSCSLRILVKIAICPHLVPICDPELKEVVLRPPSGVEPVRVDCGFELAILELEVAA